MTDQSETVSPNLKDPTNLTTTLVAYEESKLQSMTTSDKNQYLNISLKSLKVYYKPVQR